MCIQKHWRGYSDRILADNPKAAIKIQCLACGHLARVEADRLRSQQIWRECQIRSCIMIRRLWRGYQVRRDTMLIKKQSLSYKPGLDPISSRKRTERHYILKTTHNIHTELCPEPHTPQTIENTAPVCDKDTIIV